MNPRVDAALRGLLALLLIALPALLSQAAAEPLRVMSFNVRLPLAQDGANAWENRRELFIDTIAKAEPDIIATQELYKLQGDYILERLPAYAWFGTDRRGGRADEHMGVFYRHDRLRLIDFGQFWLSDTPTQPGSISWGHPFPRMVTWGLFETKADGKRFYLYNTHFPYRAEDEDARLKGARMIAERIAALPADVPLILAGDFNTTPDSEVHALLTGSLVDARTAAKSAEGPDATFHAFTGKGDRRIDWILVRGFEPRATRTIAAQRDGRYPSDHFPVLAELDWKNSNAAD